MVKHVLSAVLIAAAGAVLSTACLGGGGPKSTPTPSEPGPEVAIEEWVSTNRNVGFVGYCGAAKQGIDTGKLCISLRGERGTRRAYDLGPAFSQPTALAIVQHNPEGGWALVSVTNDPNVVRVPGIPWPLEVGDAVLIIGLGEGDCLRIRDQPSQNAKPTICMPDGTRAVIQEGPVDAETFTWWRIAGDAFNGWAAGRWLRLEDAIAAALQPRATPTQAP